MSKLSQTMQAVVDRLQAGNGRIYPKQGGYWLPEEVALTMLAAGGNAWFDRSLSEFGAKVGTTTVYALIDRGVLRWTDEPSLVDPRPRGRGLRICELVQPTPDTPERRNEQR